MPIPSQNEFLLPFLKVLGNGETLTRSQLIYRLGKHFDISEEELNDMTGNQFTVLSRVAWCDVHFCKAGFVHKDKHPHESMQDKFRIEPLGIRELNRRPEELTVGYLQSFYRGKVYRGAGSDDTTSDAELALYQAFENLPDEFTVLHSVKWFAKEKGTVGEVDFLIAHPDYGVLVMEVKGGEISMERQSNSTQWYSRSRTGAIYKISDPCSQAERNRRELHKWLSTHPQTRNYQVALFPAVAVPDSHVDSDIRPDCTQSMFIDMTHLDDLAGRLREIFRYWQSRADEKNQRMGGPDAVGALVNLLIPTRTLQPRIADIFEAERRKIEELTQQQFRILRQLRRHRRAAIVGGAGTGKTLLAMEKAQQLADAGFRVLFLCFNKQLSEWLDKAITDENIMISTFHGMVGRTRHWAGLRGTGPKMSMDEFSEKAPEIMLDALSIIRSPDSGAQDNLFDAIIVDEAQDFEAEWWIPLPDLLTDPEHGVFYVFFDDNQRLYTQISNVPMEREPFFLDENCRNTQHIHARLLPYAKTDDETVCLGPEGRAVELVPAPTKQTARKELQRVLHRLVNEDGVHWKDIIVLTPSSERRSQWKKDDQLGNFILSWDMETQMQQAIRVTTIYRFKGLESSVVIVTELDQLYEDIGDQLVYVALSRARNHVVVIGELPVPQT
jgi:hypothetical protein